MKTRIQKWGDSLALAIPEPLALEVGLHQDGLGELSLVNGQLIVSPLGKPSITLEALLADITAENIHTEVDTGLTVGKEAW